LIRRLHELFFISRSRSIASSAKKSQRL